MTATRDQLLHTLTRVCNTLTDNDVPFAVAGGCAAYARGGPASDHDVDVFVKPDDVSRASSALIAVGMRAAHPPEDWLSKVYDGDMRPTASRVDWPSVDRDGRVPRRSPPTPGVLFWVRQPRGTREMTTSVEKLGGSPDMCTAISSPALPDWQATEADADSGQAVCPVWPRGTTK